MESTIVAPSAFMDILANFPVEDCTTADRVFAFQDLPIRTRTSTLAIQNIRKMVGFSCVRYTIFFQDMIRIIIHYQI